MTDFPRFAVDIDPDAEADLEAITNYIASHQSFAIADRYLTQLLERIASLDPMPERGSYPKELNGRDRSIRQMVHGPHRIIYRVETARVVVVLVADGRRDMQALLARRLDGDRSAS